MSEPQYIHIRNWDRHQHYKRRNPVWIKVYVSLLDDPAYRSLTFFNRALLHDLWLLTARVGNGRIPWSPSYLIDVLQIHDDEDESGQARVRVGSGSGRGRDALRKRVGRGLTRLQSLGWLNQGAYIPTASDAASTIASKGDSFARPEGEGEKEETPLPPLKEESGKLVLLEETKPKRRRDPIWDALMEAFGIEPAEVTPSARGMYNRVVADLRSIDAKPGEIAARLAVYRRNYPDLKATPAALVKHWPILGNGQRVPTSAAEKYRLEDLRREAQAQDDLPFD